MQATEELRYLILAAQRDGQRIFAELLRPLGLTPSQAEVIRVLHEHQPLSLIALGDLLICEQGSPSRLVDGLVRAGYIEREQSQINRRMVTLVLTPVGEKAVARVSQVEAQLYQFIAQRLDGKAVDTLTSLLRRLVENSGEAGQAFTRRAGKQGD